ncbi:MAG: heterodisulfide reductase [Deltaproteobacteria bacterium]|nr:MAG: heterodisulfide reductase [Deltaproteobacteria bacterium]
MEKLSLDDLRLEHSLESDHADVLIVGGGISGIQAALDLGDAGFRVVLVDKAPSIGGKMAQLDKTFPTNDCSMCIESPKFIECSRHPNIEILTYTEVREVSGHAGDFNITLARKPRYIIENKCTGCGVCVEYCPAKVSDPYNQNLSENKAVHIYFSQAVPLVTYVDPDECLYLQGEKCTICSGVCKHNAIDLHQSVKLEQLNVGAVLLSPGYEVFDPSLRGDYGYGSMQNVVTSLDFERILCSTGPYDGHIRRPSDGKHPEKIGWIQCVGSRQVRPGGNSYCSAVCCAYTQKQVILAKDHDADIKATVFHNDIRAFGKDFERYYQRAENLSDVEFIRSYVSMAGEDPETKNLTIRYSTPDDGVKEAEFDMVVLSVGINPTENVKELAETFGVELNEYGFCKTSPENPIATSRPGIFVSGAFTGPLDIPESVVAASGADALCSQMLSYRRGKLSRERVYPEEKDTSGEDLKIGVFVCHCGANIGRVVDVPAVVEYASTLGNVVHAQESLFACSTENAKDISDQIREKDLNRVVVAACTPRTHEPLFRDTCREGGINPYFYEMANIREHCSWVHSREKEAATAKAKEIVRMSVSRAALLEPLPEYELPVNKAGLVVGGGLSGMTTALSMASQGFEVYLVEKEEELGGMARRVPTTIEGMDVQSHIDGLINAVYKNPLIHVWTGSRITRVNGYIGDFNTTVTTGNRERTIAHGVAVLATGAEEYKPTEYLYGESEKVLTSLELEAALVEGSELVEGARSVAMVQCVGCRDEERNYCSRLCCTQSVKNAIALKKADPNKEVYVLYRDMRTYGMAEQPYREAAGMDVKFIRYEPEAKPVVKESGGALKVTVPDPILGKMLEIDVDLVTLAAAVVPSEGSQEAARQFKVSLNPDGFFQEAHVKLRPVDFAADGVFLCGSAHYPKRIPEAISQAFGAAGRAANVLARDAVSASGAVAQVQESDCISCGACITACSYNAIGFHDTPAGKKARVNPILCKGDGLCNTKCPTGAVDLKHYTECEIASQIDAA